MSKGSILDISIIMFMFVFFIVTSFLVLKIYKEFRTKLPENDVLTKIDNAFNIQINAIPLLIFASGIGSIILAFLIPTHPVFMPISIILLGFFIITSFFFKNFVYVFLTSNQMIELSNSYPLIANTVNNLHLIIGIIGFLIIIVMYSKSGMYE